MSAHPMTRLRDLARVRGFRVERNISAVEIIDNRTGAHVVWFWDDDITAACEWLLKHFPRRPGAPKRNRNAAGKHSMRGAA